MKNKETILIVAVALIVGLLVGVLVTKSQKPNAQTQIASPQGGAPAAANYQQNIQVLQNLLAGDPKNRRAWVELGNNYFDSQQPVKAIEAYGKALDLDPRDPNVLTDQGIMYREIGDPTRALENFTKANQLEPGHLQSLVNMGIVYRYDLGNSAKAKEIWQRYLALSPVGAAADRIRQELADVDKPLAPAGQMPGGMPPGNMPFPPQGNMPK